MTRPLLRKACNRCDLQVCDVDPLSREDRDIIRLEIKQLCDSFEGVCGSLRSTDELLVSGKRSLHSAQQCCGWGL